MMTGAAWASLNCMAHWRVCLALSAGSQVGSRRPLGAGRKSEVAEADRVFCAVLECAPVCRVLPLQQPGPCWRLLEPSLQQKHPLLPGAWTTDHDEDVEVCDRNGPLAGGEVHGRGLVRVHLMLHSTVRAEGDTIDSRQPPGPEGTRT